jgi:hypothetical protein
MPEQRGTGQGASGSHQNSPQQACRLFLRAPVPSPKPSKRRARSGRSSPSPRFLFPVKGDPGQGTAEALRSRPRAAQAPLLRSVASLMRVETAVPLGLLFEGEISRSFRPADCVRQSLGKGGRAGASRAPMLPATGGPLQFPLNERSKRFGGSRRDGATVPVAETGRRGAGAFALQGSRIDLRRKSYYNVL